MKYIIELVKNTDKIICRNRHLLLNYPHFQAVIHCSASKGRSKVVQCLIERQVDLNVADNLGRTTLLCAASEGYLEIVQILLDNGAEVNAVN